MAWNYSNNSVQTVLSAGIDGVVTSIVVGSISGLPVVYPYTLILDYGASNVEVVNVTAGVGTTLTVTRGQDSTAAVAHATNAVVVHGVVARDLAEPQAHIAASTNVHGLTGGASVVGTGSAQTLSSKTLGVSNTVTLRQDRFTLQNAVDATKQAAFDLVGITTGTTRTYTLPNASSTLVDTSTAQTLTNKTVSDATFTIADDVDPTKLAKFQAASITTATTRTYTLPDANGTLADLTTYPLGVAWTDFSASFTITAVTTPPTKGNSVYTARYQQIGKQVDFVTRVSIGSTFVAGSGAYRLLLPVASNALTLGVGSVVVAGATGTFVGICKLVDATHIEIYLANNTTGAALGSAGPGAAWASGNGFDVSFRYEAA